MVERLSEKPGFKEIYEKAGLKEHLRHTPEEIRKKVEEHVKMVISHTVAQAAATPPPQQTQAQATVALEKFVELAFHEGLSAAAQKIVQTKNPYLIDEFHDLLIESFLDELKAAGKLK